MCIYIEMARYSFPSKLMCTNQPSYAHGNDFVFTVPLSPIP